MFSLVAAVPALADMWGSGWGHHGWWAGGLMMFFWLLLLLGLLLVLIRAFDLRGPSPSASDAEHVLAGRYALGEIDEIEYRSRLAVLKERR